MIGNAIANHWHWLFAVVVIPFLPTLRERAAKFLVGYVIGKLLTAVKGDGEDDKDVLLFIRMIVLALVHLAEAKFGEGLGATKKAWVHSMLQKFPIAAGYEDQVDLFLEAAVAQLNVGLKQVAEEALKDLPPSSVPDAAAPVQDSKPA